MTRTLRPRLARQPRPREPLLEDVLRALGDAPIREAPIRAPGLFVLGAHEADGTITINIGLLRVMVFLHEGVHRVRPTWGEPRVRARSWRLLHALSDGEIAALDAALCAAISTSRRRRRSSGRRARTPDRA